MAGDSWKGKLQKELPLLGHRNWIVVAESAYPLQTAPGIETIYVEADQLEVVKGVLAELAKTKHVKPTIYTDAEMKFVAETNAPGIGANGGTIDASGGAGFIVNFTNTGSMGFNGVTGARTLTLTGSNVSGNTIAALIGDNGGATSVTKTGAGGWTLSGANT